MKRLALPVFFLNFCDERLFIEIHELLILCHFLVFNMRFMYESWFKK